MPHSKLLRATLLLFSGLFLCAFLPKGCGKKETANVMLKIRIKEYQVLVNGSSVDVKDDTFAVPINTPLTVQVKKQGYVDQSFALEGFPKAGESYAFEVPVVPTPAASFEALSEDEKKAVDSKYTELEAAQKVGDSRKVYALSQEVLDKVPNYKDVRRIQVEAIQKIEDSHAGKKPAPPAKKPHASH